MKQIFVILFLLFTQFLFAQQPELPCLTTHVISDGTETVIPTKHLDPPPPGNPAYPDPQEPPAGEVDRQVFWVHGIGGSPSAWEKPANATQFGPPTGYTGPAYPARKVRSFRPTYPQTGTLATAAVSLNATINGFAALADAGITEPSDRTIVIAHSMGGLVSRTAGDIAVTPRFAGLATFASPHSGAPIANSVANGSTTAFLNDFCKDVLAGPHIAFGVYQPFPLSPVLVVPPGGPIVGPLIGQFLFSPTALCGQVEELLSDFTQPILSDIAVGAPGINALGSGNVDHKVVFSGVENDEVLWRELYHIRNKPSEYELFGANDQQRGQDRANFLKNYYSLSAIASAVTLQFKSAYDWRRGYFALRDANDKWESLIGATQYTPVSTSLCNCTVYNQGGAIYDVISYYGACTSTSSYNPNTNRTTICQNSTVQINSVSTATDGVVPQGSQLAYPGAAMGIVMSGSNHQSERNDLNTHRALMQLWSGGVGDFRFWRTEVR
jgi:pimeloyl-ACP methyl ester carboxylesterase